LPRPAVILALVSLILLPIAHAAEEEIPLEYRVKAAFIYHFTQFVEWPDNSRLENGSVTRIGILGDELMADAIMNAIEGKKVRGRRLDLVRFSSVESLEACHILFIDSSSSVEELDIILDKLRGYPVMTVGDSPGFAGRGGIVNFYKAGSKIRFEINPRAARRAGLTVSSKMLNLARIVENREDS
jgi:hypothetical protein